MNKYGVLFTVDATGYIEIEAETKEEAQELAWEQFLPTIENTELADPIQIIDVIKLDE